MELDFDETDVVALFKKKNFKAHMCVGITSNILRPIVGVSDTGIGPSLVRLSLLTVNSGDIIRLIHSISLKTFSNIPVDAIGKVELIVQLCNVQIHVHLGVVESLIVLLLTGTSFMDWWVKCKSPMERGIVRSLSRPVEIISYFMPLSDPMTVI